MRPLAVLCAAALAACCEFSGPHWHGRKSDHFDGHRFHNQMPGTAPDAMTIVSWRWHRHQGAWPEFADAPPAPAPPQRVEGLRVTLVNHATVLIQIAGFNVLTDPIWGEIAGPLRYLGRRRHRPPGLRLEDLPPIDVILLSHDHYDHLDVETLGRIVRKHHPRIVAGLGMAALLAENDIHGVTDLDWWQWIAPARDLKIYGVPARHNCRRGPCDDNARLWLGFVDGRPVATAAVHVAAGVNNVEMIATLEEDRGRGYGAAVTWAATTADPTLPAVLVASDLGRSVYERLGYTALTRWTMWLRP